MEKNKVYIYNNGNFKIFYVVSNVGQIIQQSVTEVTSLSEVALGCRCRASLVPTRRFPNFPIALITISFSGGPQYQATIISAIASASMQTYTRAACVHSRVGCLFQVTTYALSVSKAWLP